MISRRTLAAWCLILPVLGAGCDSDRGGEPSSRATPSASPDEAPQTLTLMKGKEIFFYDLQTEEQDERAITLSTTDVVMSPDGSTFVYELAPEAGEKDAEPELWSARTNTPEDVVKLGPGREPIFSPDGTKVAALVKAEGYQICRAYEQGEAVKDACKTGDRVGVYAVGESQQEPAYAIGGGLWSLLGWTSEDRIAAGSLQYGDLWVGFEGATGEEQARVQVRSEAVLALSPIATEAAIASADGLQIAGLSEAGEARQVQGDYDVASWSPDGGTIVARRSDDGRLVLIEVASGEVSEVPRSRGATGEVVWHPEGGHFVHVRHVKPVTDIQLCDLELSCARAFATFGKLRALALN